MSKCKGFEKDPYLYVYYIHGWLIPHLDQLRGQSKLKQGTKEIKIYAEKCKYTGELDQKGLACGFGEAVTKQGWQFRGTFMNDVAHGFCK